MINTTFTTTDAFAAAACGIARVSGREKTVVGSGVSARQLAGKHIVGTELAVVAVSAIAPTYPTHRDDLVAVRGDVFVDGIPGPRSWSPPV